LTLLSFSFLQRALADSACVEQAPGSSEARLRPLMVVMMARRNAPCKAVAATHTNHLVKFHNLRRAMGPARSIFLPGAADRFAVADVPPRVAWA
jgi:hypothetical protein